jgi:hypothetical protein
MNKQELNCLNSTKSLREIGTMKLIIYRKNRQKFYLNFNFNKKRYRIATPFGKDQKREAHNYAVDFRYKLQKELQNPQLYKDITFNELLESYLYEKGLKPSYLNQSLFEWIAEVDNDAKHLTSFCKQYSNKNIQHIAWKNERVRIIKEERDKGNKCITANKKLSTLRSILNHATEKEWLNTITIKSLKETDNRNVETFTYEWLFEVLYPCLPEHLKDPFELTFLVGGERRGNIVELQQRHITDFKQLHIPANEVKNRTSAINKTLGDRAWKIIQRNIDIDPSNPYIFKGHNNRGHLGDFKRAWDTARTKADVGHKQWTTPTGNTRGEWAFRWHDIRHSVGHDLHRQGATAFEIRDTLGHLDLRSTNKYVGKDEKAMFERQLDREKRIEAIKVTPKVTPAGISYATSKNNN